MVQSLNWLLEKKGVAAKQRTEAYPNFSGLVSVFLHVPRVCETKVPVLTKTFFRRSRIENRSYLLFPFRKRPFTASNALLRLFNKADASAPNRVVNLAAFYP
jgi:hypothetical protein